MRYLGAVLRRRGPLLALCVGLVLVEAIGLQVTGFRSALPLSPQISAPVSLGTYHDLRWLFTFHASWAGFGWELVVLVVFRCLVTVGMIALAWPVDVPRESIAGLLRRNVVATLIAVVALSPWAAIAFAAQVVAYSWLMIFSIIASLATALVLPLAVTGRWWRRLLLWPTMGWVVLTWLAATVEALVVSLSPGWVAVLAAVAGGLVNAALWVGLVRTIVRAGEPVHARPLAPVALVGVLAVLLVGGGYLVGAAAPDDEQPTVSNPAHGGQPVLYVSGFGSRYDGGDFALFTTALNTRHYSYKGLGEQGPLAYGPQWTHQAVGVSAAKLARQVDWLHEQTGEPVALIADSEGTLVAREYFTRHRNPPVDYYIMASPLPRPARVYYPAAGEQGWGLAGGWETRLLLRMVQALSPDFTARADMPLARSIAAHAGTFRPSILCPVGGGVRTYAFIPLSAATVVYHGPVSHVPWTALPGWHASLLDRGLVTRDIERLLTTGELAAHRTSTTAFRLIYGAAAAWQAPALPLDFRAGWGAAPHTDPAFARWHCGSSSGEGQLG